MVGNNMSQAQGMCGSSSGSIPVNVGPVSYTHLDVYKRQI